MNQETIGDCCELVSEQVDPQKYAGTLYVGLEHLVAGRCSRIGGGVAADVQSSKFRFKKGDVLYGKLRPYLDKAILADTDGVCTTELLVLRPKYGVDARFMVGVLHAPAFVEHAMSGVTGVQHPRTSWNRVSEFLVPRLAPSERRRIGDAVWAVERALSLCGDALAAAEQLKQVAMRELFARGLRREVQKHTDYGPIPESWSVAKLGECATVQTGVAKGRKFGDTETIRVPYLRVANVQDGRLDLKNVKTIEIKATEEQRYLLRPGDVVLTEGGDLDKLGRGFIWRNQLESCVHQNHIFAVRPDSERLLPDYLAHLVQGAYGKAYFLRVAHKTTNLACINTTKLKAFPVPLPSLKEQWEIIAILDAIDRKIDLHKRKASILEKLLKTLLNALMAGAVGRMTRSSGTEQGR